MLNQKAHPSLKLLSTESEGKIAFVVSMLYPQIENTCNRLVYKCLSFFNVGPDGIEPSTHRL